MTSPSSSSSHADEKQFIADLISRMSLEQKIGQCFVLGFCGSVVTPTILARIRRIKPSGIRAGLTFRAKTALHDPYATSDIFAHRVLRDPVGSVKDLIPGILPPHCSNSEYCEFLNSMKKAALEDGLGVPLHVTMDMEGDLSCDYPRGGIHYFPSPLGATASGNPRMARDIAWATGRQLAPVGINWLHSPVLDINSEPRNPEIGARSYGACAADVLPFAREAVAGFRDAGIIATGKHFPGRGASASDAHRGLPVIDLSPSDMEEHLKPFRDMVEAGIPCIMSAHTLYPCLDPDNPATMSHRILTELLKDEWGFEGCVTSDDITMGGIVERYEVHDACIAAINAGCDLILLRDESPLAEEVFEKVVEAARDGRITPERLDDALTRSLSVKYRYGLFENGNLRDPEQASSGINDPRVAEIASASAQAAIKILRDEQGVLPLSRKTKVLVVEQCCPLHRLTDTQRCHPGIFWEAFFDWTDAPAQVEVPMDPSAADMERIFKRLHEADVIVTTNYFDRRAHAKESFVDKLLAATSKPIVVVTNSPYPFTVRDTYKTVLVTHGVSPESLKIAVQTLYSGVPTTS